MKELKQKEVLPICQVYMACYLSVCTRKLSVNADLQFIVFVCFRLIRRVLFVELSSTDVDFFMCMNSKLLSAYKLSV